MFDGDINIVNGTAWPNMNVQQHAYRFRFLNSVEPALLPAAALERAGVHESSATTADTCRSPQTVTAFNIGVTERVDIGHRLLEASGGDEDRPAERENSGSRPSEGPRRSQHGRHGHAVHGGGRPVVPPARVAGHARTAIAYADHGQADALLIQNVESDDQGGLLQAELDGQLFHTQTTELPTIGSTEDWSVHQHHAAHAQQARAPDRVPGGQAEAAQRRAATWRTGREANGNPPFDSPDAEAGSHALLERCGAGAATRGERLEGHGAHAGRPGH